MRDAFSSPQSTPAVPIASSPRTTPEVSAFSSDSAFGQSLAGVRLTPQDAKMLTLIDEQYALTIDQLRYASALCGSDHVVSERNARGREARWERRRLTARARRGGRDYVVLTSAGRTFVGSDYPLWSAPEARLAHTEAVAWFRLWFESDPTRVADNGRWVSERRLFRERGTASWHLHDAELEHPQRPTRIGVEVELTYKTPAWRYRDILADLGPHVGGVMYVCAPAIVANVTRAVERYASGSVPVWVRPLPDLRQSTTEDVSS